MRGSLSRYLDLQALVQQLPDPEPGSIDWDPERRLSVGYVSPDLFTHSVSYFAEAPLTHHDSSRCVTDSPQVLHLEHVLTTMTSSCAVAIPGVPIMWEAMGLPVGNPKPIVAEGISMQI